MIPLRSNEELKRFPKATLLLCGLYIALYLVSCFSPGHESRHDFLLSQALYSDSLWSNYISSLVFHHGFFSLAITVIYLWVFSPRVHQRRGWPLSLATATGGAVLSLASFQWLHPGNSVGLLTPEAVVGVYLGLFMRRDIWGSVSTLVVGHFGLRVFDVPSYVLLFFWFFYLLIQVLLLKAPFSDAPMLYWIPFVAFLFGFFVESFFKIFDSKSGD